jgi:prephenate dehydratase
MKIYAVGPVGSYGSELARILSQKPLDSKSNNVALCSSHQEVFSSILNSDGLCSVGSIAILPIENSNQLLVGDVVRLWMGQPKGASHLKVIGERLVKIKHQLLVRLDSAGLKSVKKVMSHPQALGQCSKYLDTIGIHIRIPTSSTADAARRLAGDSTFTDTAVIASEFAAAIYGLVPATKEKISNHPSNVTRFHIIGWANHLDFGTDDASAMIIWLKNSVGALNSVTSCFARHNVNISCLHSMPSGTLGKYAFYIEVDYDLFDDDGLRIQQELRKVTERIKVIGSFRRNPIAVN